MKASSIRKILKGALLTSVVAGVAFAFTGNIDAAQKDKAPKIDPNDPSSVIYLDTSGKPAGLGDPSKPPSVAYKAGQGWHPQALSAAGLPKDKYGLVDWAKLVRENIIKPKPSLDPNADEMPPLKMDVVIPAKGDFVNDVLYPHEMHTYWLKCEVCHPKIFVPAKGQNNMTMVGIVQGKWCGRCHGKVAFPLTDCNRCHTVPKKGASASK
jgi:c(7)-type cytochrome triheme protein